MFFTYRESTAKYTFAVVGLIMGSTAFFDSILEGTLACVVLASVGHFLGSRIQKAHEEEELESLMAYARSIKQQAEAERAKRAAERT